MWPKKTQKKFFRPQILGRIQSYLARESEPHEKLIKYLKTMRDKYGFTEQELKEMLEKAKRESVDPFLKPKGLLYQPQRLDRYRELRKALSARFNG